ncbi:MAG: ABC transporter permease [Solirubrobacterales bacterium]|nr:ABC transporter permease [Solirubrobacterales bacterium]
MLWRKALRDLRAMGMRALLIVVVIGAGAGTGAGISLALHDVERTRDDFYSEYRLADLDVRLLRPLAPRPLLRRARQVGARPAETRLVLSGEALMRGGAQPAAEVVGMSPAAVLDGLAVTGGRALSSAAPRGALLDPDFAERFHLHLGDRLRLRLGGRRVELRIRGLARSPEYLLATANPDYLVPQPGSLAVVFLPRASLQRITGLGERVNDLVVDLPGRRADRRGERLAAGLPVAALTPRSQQYSLRLTNADINAFSIFAPVMGGIFALVGLLLIVLSLRRLVNSQRRELGALLALGYPPRTVVATVLLPAAFLALAGGLLAMAVTVGVGRLVAAEYSNTVGFPSTSHALAAGPLALAAGLALGATLLAAAAPAYRLARLEPTQAMRGERFSTFGLSGWLQRATGLWPPAVAYAIRGLLRRPLLSAATVFSIAVAIGLAAALNILVSSTNSAVDTEFAQQGWTYSVDLARPLPASRAAALARRAGARRAEATIKGPARLRSGGRDADVELAGLPARPPLLRLGLTAGSSPAPGGVVVSEQTARSLRVGVGDELEVRTPAARTKLAVAGIARTLATQSTYLPRAQASRLLGSPGHATSVLVAAGPAAARRLRRDPAVARVTSKSSAQSAEREMIEELTGLISVLQAISLGVGAIFLVSVLALSYLDRRGEFATLAALGYGRRQIGAAVAGEALTQTAIAAALSIPLGILIASPLSDRIAQAWFEIGLHAEPPNFIWVIVLALVLALLAVAQATRRALRIDIAVTVRERLID